jgi:flavin-dependent dehydrogenase
MSLSRRVLDEALLACAQRAGAIVLRGRRVESLRREDAGWAARLSDGEELQAANAFVATGKHDLRGWPREEGKQNDLVAFKMYFQLAPERQAELAGSVDLILFSDGYAGLQSVEQGAANLCLVVKRSRLRRCGGGWGNLLEHLLARSRHLARLLEGATAMLEKPLALSAIPYGYVRRETWDGLWRLGDQAAVIPSFSGDGISIALHGAHLAAMEYLRGQSAGAFQRKLCLQLRPAVSAATMLSRLMIVAPALAQGVRLRPAILGTVTRETRIPRTELLVAG